MASNEIKMRVAQNCPGYFPKYAMNLHMSTHSESCDMCANFVRGKCVKELFDEVKETIRLN